MLNCRQRNMLGLSHFLQKHYALTLGNVEKGRSSLKLLYPSIFSETQVSGLPQSLFRQLTQYVLHHVQLDPYLYLVKNL